MRLDQQRTSRLFQKLMRVAPELKLTKEHTKSSVSGLMDLNLDVLEINGDYRRIALSHYWKHPSGDMIADPDMEISVFLAENLAEALTYQDAFEFQNAYSIEGEPPDLAVHIKLNVFLEHWLDILASQGHVLPRGH